VILKARQIASEEECGLDVPSLTNEQDREIGAIKIKGHGIDKNGT